MIVNPEILISPDKLPATQARLDFARYLRENAVPVVEDISLDW